ncbi:MAG: PKD domain-containing protein, partial [Sediminibacterium sp.]
VNGSVPNPSFVVQAINTFCSNDSLRITNTSTVDFGSITRLDIYWDSIGSPTSFVRDENPTPGKVYTNLYTSFTAPSNKKIGVKILAYSGNSSVCRKTISQVVTLNNYPKVSFLKPRDICNDADPRHINQGTFQSALSASGSYSGIGVAANGDYSPKTVAAGTYNLQFKAVNSAGCKDSASQPITVWPSPVAKWGVQAILCEKNNIAFTDSSVANFSNIAQRKWNYGDGVNETRTSVTSFNRVYTTAQTYNVGLQVITDSGCVSTINQQSIKVNPLPQPAFTLPTVVCLPDGRATFTNQSTIADSSQSLFSYLWNFGDPFDATPSLLKEPTHKYSALGPVNVKLSITSKDGCVDSLTKSFNNVYPWPKANLGMNVTTACVGDTVYFMDNGNGMSSSAASWRWDLGQGFSSTLKNPSRQFNDSGTYTISYYFFNA